MEHVEHHTGRKGSGGMALVGGYIEDLARLKDVWDPSDRKLQGARQYQRPLLVRMGVIGNHSSGSDLNPALGNVL